MFVCIAALSLPRQRKSSTATATRWVMSTWCWTVPWSYTGLCERMPPMVEKQAPEWGWDRLAENHSTWWIQHLLGEVQGPSGNINGQIEAVVRKLINGSRNWSSCKQVCKLPRFFKQKTSPNSTNLCLIVTLALYCPCHFETLSPSTWNPKRCCFMNRRCCFLNEPQQCLSLTVESTWLPNCFCSPNVRFTTDICQQRTRRLWTSIN